MRRSTIFYRNGVITTIQSSEGMGSATGVLACAAIDTITKDRISSCDCDGHRPIIRATRWVGGEIGDSDLTKT